MKDSRLKRQEHDEKKTEAAKTSADASPHGFADKKGFTGPRNETQGLEIRSMQAEEGSKECYDFGNRKVCNVCDPDTGVCELREEKPRPVVRDDDR